MKKNLLVSTALAVCLISTIFYFSIPKATLPNLTELEAQTDGPGERTRQEFELTKDPRLNIVPVERLVKAKEVQDQRLASGSFRESGAVAGINWVERGPNNVGGRTRALMFDLNDVANGYKKVWAAGVGGGLWYTNDITATTPVWNKVNDLFDNIAITCIAQNPLNPEQMYFGTGEGWLNADAIRGLGIWKSTNAGATWSRITSRNFGYVHDLQFDRLGALYVATRAAVTGDAAGVQKTSDGGNSFVQVLGTPVFGSVSQGADLELAANGDLYATLGVSGTNGGIYISDYKVNQANTGNAGTWTNITPNTTGVIATPANLWNRIEIACAPSDSNVVYALFQGSGTSDCTSIQRYNRSTNTWSVRTVPTIIDQGANSNFTRSQAWYDLIAAVDPNHADTLYIGGVDALRSRNGGTSWTQMTSWSLFSAPAFTEDQRVHADQHAIVYAPGSSSRAIWGTDGGVDYTATADTATKPIFFDKNIGYNVTQFYAVAMHPTLPNYFLAGAQDNGSQKFTTAGMNTTTEASGGDGAFAHIDQTNGNIQITSYVYNNYYVSTNNGASFAQRSFSNSGGFINPTDYDNVNKMLYGANTAGNYFRWNDPATAGTSTSIVSVARFGTASVTHVTVSPLTASRVFFGLSNGSVVRVDSANTGTNLTGTVIKTGVGSVSCVAVDLADEDHMLVTYSNYGVVSIFESKNATQPTPTWSSIEGNLPDMPVRWVMFDPRNSDWALIATEVGVWSTDDINSEAVTDWQPTNLGLANTRVDMLKYRASDRTLAAATHGRGLYTTTVPNVTTPDINYAVGVSVGTEDSAAAISCRSYRDYNVQLNISNAPTGDAVLTFDVQSAATATQQVDFDLYMNGDFSAPKNTLTFPSGATASKSVTIRVYNDAEIETAELFRLNYSISGATNARKGTGFQSLQFTINDNDVAPVSRNAGDFAVGTGTDTIAASSPFRADKQKHRVQSLYRASELNAAGIEGAGTITGMRINVLTKRSTRPYSGFTISIANTSASSFSNYLNPVFTTVYSGDYSSVVGDNNFTFTTPFVYDGSSNIVVQICYDNGVVNAPELVADSVKGTANTFGAGVRASVYSNHTNGATGAGCAIGAAFISDNRMNASFTASVPGTPIAVLLNSSKTEYLPSTNDLYFYSNNTNTRSLLARVRSLSTFNYGCTQVTLDRSGTGASAFWNNRIENYLMNKTYRIVPSTNSTTGQYTATFYLTKEEVEGWQTVTGQSFDNILLVKVPSQITNVNPGNPQPDGPNSIQVVVPTRARIGLNYSLTATFTNGFSGFGFGIPGSAFPVTLLDFTGKLQGDFGLLDWNTTAEANSKEFEIEKSFDGTNFRKLGSVKAAGFSSGNRNYTFTDREVALDKNYYRLRMIDTDGKAQVSKVVLLRNPKAKQGLYVLNNPFNSYIDVRFGVVPQGRVTLRLTDLNGKLYNKSEFSNVAQSQLRFNLSKAISKGIYILTAEVDGTRYTSKVMKD